MGNESVLENQSEFFRKVTRKKSFKEYVSKLILIDDNAFTKAAASGKIEELPQAVINGVKSDLQKLEAISNITSADIYESVESESLRGVLKTLPQWETGAPLLPLTVGWENQMPQLIEYHKNHGYGMYSEFNAFTWRNHSLYPLSETDPILLSDLKNYELQRQKVVDNTESFVNGYPSNNVLLYGDRGTGKSSTVHAVLNEYADKGLRMIEITKSDIPDLTIIRERLASCPMKFIIFIDDLYFDSHDDSFGELKAALEGASAAESIILLYMPPQTGAILLKKAFRTAKTI